jgi:antitoxin (DNA-binding transcriptional repressor) of toxin-antitoxin stability system
MMKRYTISQVRMRLAEALDSAESGETVVIERRGVQFKLEATKTARRANRKPVLKILDPAVEAGDWAWRWGSDGFAFVPGKATKTGPAGNAKTER